MREKKETKNVSHTQLKLSFFFFLFPMYQFLLTFSLFSLFFSFFLSLHCQPVFSHWPTTFVLFRETESRLLCKRCKCSLLPHNSRKSLLIELPFSKEEDKSLRVFDCCKKCRITNYLTNYHFL